MGAAILTAWLALALLLQAAPSSSAAVGLPSGSALDAAIAAQSDDYFTLFLEKCDPERLRTMLQPDFEMYHDQNGVVARGREPFVGRYAERCPPRLKPGGNRLRRVLRPDTRKVYPVPGYGAIEEGWNDYYGSVGGRPERKVSEARYFSLWALTPDGWRVARAFSHDHRDSPRLPPIKPSGEASKPPSR